MIIHNSPKIPKIQQSDLPKGRHLSLVVPGSYLETSFLSGKKIEEKDKTLRLSKFVCSDTLISDQGVLSEADSGRSLARTVALAVTLSALLAPPPAFLHCAFSNVHKQWHCLHCWQAPCQGGRSWWHRHPHKCKYFQWFSYFSGFSEKYKYETCISLTLWHCPSCWPAIFVAGRGWQRQTPW